MGGKIRNKIKNKNKIAIEEKKTDMERLGLFKEDSYIFTNTPYTPLDTFVWNESAHTGKQLKIQHSGKKDGTDGGYFNPFIRTFRGEGPSSPLKLDRLEKRANKSNYYAGEFIYSSPGEKIYSSGHYSGTFSGPIPYFKPTVINKEPGTKKKNMKIVPPKKGSGYGDVDCCINPYPEAMPRSEEKFKIREDIDSQQIEAFYNYFKAPDYMSKYPYCLERVKPYSKPIPVNAKYKMLMKFTTEPTTFKLPGKGKSLGGNKDGCFSKFPYYSMQDTIPHRKVSRPKPILTTGLKSSAFKSVVETNVNKRVTYLTYKQLESVMYVKQKNTVVENDKTCI